MYECYRDPNGYTCLVLVNGREYQTDLSYESDTVAMENAAMRAFMVCRNFSINGGMLARNGIVQGLPADDSSSKHRRGRQSIRRPDRSSAYGSTHRPRPGRYSSSDSSLGSHSTRSRASATSESTVDDEPPMDDSQRSQAKVPRENVVAMKRAYARRQLYTVTDGGKPIPVADLFVEAVSSLDHPRARFLLEKHFSEVAVGEYSWVWELRSLGYNPTEIADELLEKAIHGPWIFEPFEVPDTQPYLHNFHQSRCVHGSGPRPEQPPALSNTKGELLDHHMETDPGSAQLSLRQCLDYFCGLGGARPASHGSLETELASVTFHEEDSMAIVTQIGPEDDEPVLALLESLERAARVLQDLGGCCDSFTFLYEHENCVEMHKVQFSLIRRLRQQIGQAARSKQDSEVLGLISQILPWIGEALPLIDLSTSDFDPASLYSLAAQFLSLALLSYAQAHCGPIRPFFLDTPLRCVVLTGRNNSELHPGLLCCVGSLVELTCMGDMTGQPVFAFRFLTCVDKATLPNLASKKFDLIACPEDILDTWGPGQATTPMDDPSLFLSISVGGGVIVPVERKDPETIQLHWSRESVPSTELKYPFNRDSKYTIGTTLSENTCCRVDSRVQLRNAVPMLEDMGTFSSYWDISERQVGVGIQSSPAGMAAFQFNQTWVKMAGETKKSTLLGQQAIHIADLESLFGVQVSVCTGIARRVRLRDLLADVLPAYIAGLVAKPPLWKALVNDYGILLALRELDLKTWLDKLSHEHQMAFECLVFAILLLLRDTGIDRNAQNFIIACLQPDLPLRCFKVPCKKENYWARMLADSDDVATFAYITTQCLETDRIKCRGLEASWVNSTALLRTEVSCYEERTAAVTAAATTAIGSSSSTTQWALKHSQAYLIGKPDSALFVQVDRPNDKTEPRLLVSISSIPPAYLYRFYRKGRPGKPRRLKEKKAFDDFAEGCVVLVGRTKPERSQYPTSDSDVSLD